MYPRQAGTIFHTLLSAPTTLASVTVAAQLLTHRNPVRAHPLPTPSALAPDLSASPLLLQAVLTTQLGTFTFGQVSSTTNATTCWDSARHRLL
jgi:hypothetical protein